MHAELKLIKLEYICESGEKKLPSFLNSVDIIAK